MCLKASTCKMHCNLHQMVIACFHSNLLINCIYSTSPLHWIIVLAVTLFTQCNSNYGSIRTEEDKIYANINDHNLRKCFLLQILLQLSKMSVWKSYITSHLSKAAVCKSSYAYCIYFAFMCEEIIHFFHDIESVKYVLLYLVTFLRCTLPSKSLETP